MRNIRLLMGLLTGFSSAAVLGCDGGGPLTKGQLGPGPSTGPVDSNGSTTGAPSPSADTSDTCVANIDFHDGSLDGLALGPGDQVFLAPTIDKAPVTNYEMQVVFPKPSLTAIADFESSRATRAELSLLPAGCRPSSLAGRAVRVELLWSLDGAIGLVPDHGVSLGTTTNGQAVTFIDASKSCTSDPNVPGNVPDSGCAPRTLNTLNPLDLVHTFDAGEGAAGGLYLRVDLVSNASTGPIPTTVHVASITWQ